jgi:hypothetical protein
MKCGWLWRIENKICKSSDLELFESLPNPRAKELNKATRKI